MTATLTNEAKKMILESATLPRQEPPAASLFFDTIEIWKNPETHQLEVRALMDGKHIATLPTTGYVNFDAGDVLTIGRMYGYLPVSPTPT